MSCSAAQRCFEEEGGVSQSDKLTGQRGRASEQGEVGELQRARGRATDRGENETAHGSGGAVRCGFGFGSAAENNATGELQM